MIERIGVHGADQANIIRTLADMWEKIRQLHPTFAMLGELAIAPQQNRRFLLNERKPHACRHRLWQFLAMQFVELRLRIEQIDMTRCPLRQEEDAVLRL